MNLWNFFGSALSTETLPIQHVEGGTLETLDQEDLVETARRLVKAVSRNAARPTGEPMGLLTVSSGNVAQLMNAIPGLRTLDVDAIQAADVSRIARYVRVKMPGVYAGVIDELSTDLPDAAVALEVVE